MHAQKGAESTVSGGRGCGGGGGVDEQKSRGENKVRRSGGWRESDQSGERETRSGTRAGLKLRAKERPALFSHNDAHKVSFHLPWFLCHFLRDLAYTKGGGRWLGTVGTLPSLRMPESSFSSTGTWLSCHNPGQGLLNRIPGQVWEPDGSRRLEHARLQTPASLEQAQKADPEF